MHHLKGIATLSVGARGAGRRQVRGHAAWARTGNVGPSRADHGSVRGGHMLPERRTTRPPHGCRCRGNSSSPHMRISTLFRTLSLFSFPFLFLPLLVGRYLSNYLCNKTCDLSYTCLPLFFSFLFLVWFLGR
jgi:hypothetical protein